MHMLVFVVRVTMDVLTIGVAPHSLCVLNYNDIL